MATVTVELEPGESVTVTCESIYEFDDDPDGDEVEAQEKTSVLKAVGQ